MRVATWNIEWFNSLFDNSDKPLVDDDWSSRWNITRREQLESIAIVFSAIDADAVLVVEAPDTNGRRSSVAALEAFAALYGLRTSKAVSGFANDTQQEISLLYDPDKLTASHEPQGAETAGQTVSPRFDRVFRIDLDIDTTLEKVEFSKPPLELAVETAAGNALRLIGVHAKSKAPHGARNVEEAHRISIENRRKQLAQCVWIRKRVEEHLEAGDDVIVLGDFNDGPGLDEYEKLFGRSGVEIVMGEEGTNCLFDPHARQAMSHGTRILGGGAIPVTARFFIHQENRYLSALLDYIMVSTGLRRNSPQWRIWHPFDDKACYETPELRDALLTASDHFPVTLDLNI